MSNKYENKRCLIIGCGSIGTRHASILKSLGCQVSCLSRRDDLPFRTYKSLKEALASTNPDLVVVANTTAEHYDTCKALEQLGYSGLALIEKPLGLGMPQEAFTPSYDVRIAYNLRFHPLILRLRERLIGRKIFSAQLTVGQYLPSWRPDCDYKQSYSSSAELGGGVLRDLSHELDLALWLFGPLQTTTARIGCWGNLEISSEDTVDILAVCDRCPSVNIHLDYQNLFPQRHIIIQAEDLSLDADIVNGVLYDVKGVEGFKLERNDIYEAQLTAIIERDYSISCSWTEGLKVMEFIKLAETASRSRIWESA